jgi:uncharacterized membrane protein
MSYIPKGCDQQGRYPEAAEAATEVGVEEEDYTAMIDDIAIAAAVIMVIAAIVLWVM